RSRSHDDTALGSERATSADRYPDEARTRHSVVSMDDDSPPKPEPLLALPLSATRWRVTPYLLGSAAFTALSVLLVMRGSLVGWLGLVVFGVFTITFAGALFKPLPALSATTAKVTYSYGRGEPAAYEFAKCGEFRASGLPYAPLSPKVLVRF